MSKPSKQVPRYTWIAVGLLVGGGLILFGPGRFMLQGGGSNPSQQIARLQDADAEVRKQTAWQQLPEVHPQVADFLVAQLLGAEPSHEVRAAYAYTLGRSQHRTAMPALEQVLDSDPHPLVRTAAWLAVARLDPQHCRALLAAASPPGDDWDRLALAQAEMVCGQMHRVSDVVRLAGQGDHAQKVLAGRVLSREVVPLIDMVGRWPLGEQVPGGDQPWPEQTLERLRVVSADLDFAALRLHFEVARPLVEACRGNLVRVSSARNWLSRRMFGGSADAGTQGGED